MLKLRIHTLILCLTMVVMFFACTVSTTKQKQQKETVRDTSITPQNAFINLFLDSANVAAFLDSVKISPEDSLAISNFYVDRNYQFAWFDTAGLTEHASSF